MYIFEFINVSVEIAIAIFYCNGIFKTKPINKWFKYLFVVTFIFAAFFAGIQRSGMAINLAVSFCICCCISEFLYEGKIKTKLFISAVYIVIAVVSDIAATLIITLFGIEYKLSGGDMVTYIAGAMLSNFVKLWLLAYVSKVLSRKIRDLPLSYWIFLFVCPMLSIVCLVIFDFYLMQAATINAISVLIPSLCILYINFMLFKFFENYSEQIRLQVVERTAQSKEENYKLLQDNETELRKLRHDMGNHIMMLHEYIAHNNTTTAFEHLENLQTVLNEIPNVVCTSNPAIDAAINIGSRKAQTVGIEYRAQIIGSALIGIEAGDICKFLSNAIDNAIEGCEGCDKPYVYTELNISEENVKIHIENSTLHENKPSLFEFITTKPDKENHGYGMKNMRSVVKKYNGIMRNKIINDIFYLDAVLYSANIKSMSSGK